MRRGSLAGMAALAVAASAAEGAEPVVLELFTSQSCSSCPPADALLAELARTRPDVLPLAFHVTYWDGTGWRDPFALPAATARQRHYATELSDRQVYTPEAVIDGRETAVGSDRQAVLAAIRRAQDRPAAATVGAARDGDQIRVTVAAGSGAGTLWIAGYDRYHLTDVRGGENGGYAAADANAVRSLADAGRWTGAALELAVPWPAGEHAAVLLQADDGAILGAARVAEASAVPAAASTP